MIADVLATGGIILGGIVAQLPILALTAGLFTILSFVSRTPGTSPAWWLRRGALVDLVYLFALPVAAALARMTFLIWGATLIARPSGADSAAEFLYGGYGLFATLGFWWQLVIYLLVADLLLYWLHRLFHRPALWPVHAVHHSSEDLDWLSTFRFHPLNVVFHTALVDSLLLLLGIAPAVLIMLAPFQVLMSAFVHANLDWDLGPLRYVLATPRFHRWHHTHPDEGGERNFASTFPMLDVMFGTFYLPADKRPTQFGVTDPAFPADLPGQLLYPFRRAGKEPGSTS